MDKACFSGISSYFPLSLSEIHIPILLARYIYEKPQNYSDKSKYYRFSILIENIS